MKHPKHSAGFVLYHRPAHEKPRGGRGTFLRAASLFVAAACLTLSVTVYPASAATSMSSLQNKLNKLSQSIEQHKPVMMSEYGADTVAGLHTAGAEMFSEEFQVEFYRRLDAEFDKRPWFVGEFVWNFADYDTVQGPMRVDGNKKGLFTRDRRPKLGMHFLRQRWAEIPTFGFKE